jgi:hypothetical protein
MFASKSIATIKERGRGLGNAPALHGGGATEWPD